MDHFYENKEVMITSSSLKNVVDHYFPKEFLKNVDHPLFRTYSYLKNGGEEVLRYLLDNSDHKLRMYGSAEEMSENLRIFRKFSRCHQFFNFARIEPYYTIRHFYNGDNGQRYIMKQDVFCLLQSLIHTDFVFTKEPHVSPILTVFLKSKEDRLKQSLEFTPFDEKCLNSLLNNPEFELLKQSIRKVENSASLEPPQISEDQYLALFADLVPQPSSIQEKYFIRQCVSGVYRKVKSPEARIAFHRSFFYMKMLLETLSKVMNSRPEIFLPWIDQPKDKETFKIPAVVRVFTDGKNSFMIEDELEEAMGIAKTGKAQPSRKIDGNLLYTIENSLAGHFYAKEGIDNVTFVTCPIQRTAHVATPIPTNFGMFVICGFDALLQILRRVIFVHKVFQKITKKQDSIFQNFIEILNGTLKLEENRHYLLNMETFYQLEKQSDEYWDKHLPNVTAKDVRNAKVDGFTLQNLKNELVHLGLTEIFPVIQDFAQVAYEYVNSKKAEKHLRTCDLFAAVEHCQMFCILKTYPILEMYMHKQKACDRIVGLECPSCQMLKSFGLKNNTIIRTSNESLNSQITTYPISAARLERSSDEYLSEIDWKITIPEANLEVYHNFSLFEFDELYRLVNSKKIGLFLLDKQEFEAAQKQKNGDDMLALVKLLGSSFPRTQNKNGFDLKSFLGFSDSERKTVYLRSITTCMENEPLIFAQDVVDLLFYSSAFHLPLEKTAEELSKQWKTNNKETYRGIRLEEVQELFDTSAVPIVIVPDPFSSVARHQMIRESGFPIMYTLSPDGQVVVHRDQAIYHIFQTIASRVDWDQEYCQQHPNCMENFKKIVLQFMMSYEKMDANIFVTLESVDKKIKSLESMCNFKVRYNQPETRLTALSHQNFDDPTDVSIPEATLKPFILPNFNNSKKQGPVSLKVWQLRYILETDLFEKSLLIDESYKCLRQSIIKSLNFKIPLLELQPGFQIMNQIANSHTIDLSFLDQTSCMKGNQITNCQKIDFSFVNQTPSRTGIFRKYRPENYQEEEDEFMTPIKDPEPAISKVEMPTINLGQLRLEKLNEHAFYENQIKELNRQLADHENCGKLVENLKAQIKKSEGREKKLKETNKVAIDSKNRLNKKVNQLESEIKQKKSEFNQKLEAEKTSHAIRKSTLENEVVLKNRELERLQNENLVLTFQCEERDRTIQELTDRVSKIPVPGEPVELTEKSKSKIEDYQRLKKSIGEQLRKARRMADRLATKTIHESTLQMALYELSQFDAQLRKYIETINQNIEKIESTNSCSNISPLPDYPSFSQRFLEEYWKLPNDSSEGPSTSGLEDDMECLICHDEMTKGQENLLKCHECTRFYHIECIAKWVHEKRCCPVCKVTLVDPNEIPIFD